MEALSSPFFTMGSENGAVADRMNNFQRPNNFAHSGELMPFGFKPEFMYWNLPQPYNPYSPSCARIPADGRPFDRLPSYCEESTGSHEVLSKDESSDSATDSHGNSLQSQQQQRHQQQQQQNPQQQLQPQPQQQQQQQQQQQYESPDDANSKKKRDRFKGMSEDEVLMRMLPDHLVPNLDIVIIGINHGLTAAYVGHHYAGPGNHFWKCLYMSGLIPEPMNCYDDYRLLHYGIGFTNIVARCTKGSNDLTRGDSQRVRYCYSKELKEGIEILTAKIQKYKPKIAVFNGKGIYEIFCGNKNFYVGKQPDPFPGTTNTTVFVMPSSSARCSQLPRAVDKVPFYVALRKLRDYRRGDLPHLDESEVTFPDLELKVEPRKDRLDRQLKQQQEAAAAAARAKIESRFDKKRRLDGSDPDFDTMFPGMCSGYPGFPVSRSSNGFVPSASGGASWGPAGWTMPGMPPPLGFQHPSSAGSSLVQRLSQVPTMDSMFGSMTPLLLKSEDGGSSASSQYGQFDPCSSRAAGYWPSPTHHYGGGAFTNYPYGFQSLYGAASVSMPSTDGQYSSTRSSVTGTSFPYSDGAAATTSDLHTLSSAYPANLHAAAAAAAYDSSSFFLPPGMSSGHLAGPSWPAAHQYPSSRSAASYADPFGRDGLDMAGMSVAAAAAAAGGFDPRA